MPIRLLAVSARSWDPHVLHAHAESFDEPVFETRPRAVIEATVEEYRGGVSRRV